MLAVDLSTVHGSVALFEGAVVRGEHVWEDGVRGHTRLAQECGGFLGRMSCCAEEIARFAVGIGPGSFSGLRASIAFLQGMALPGDRRVCGVSSAAATALTHCGNRDGKVMVAGDARRERFWAGVFAVRGDGLVTTVSEPALTDAAGVRALMEPGMDVVTPDWGRIGEILAAISGPARVVEGIAKPSASAVGRLAVRRFEGGEVEMPRPVYLHPPVFVEPKAQ